jgi:antitoxin component YwqK of YwqJK toxin-antitoxin module
MIKRTLLVSAFILLSSCAKVQEDGLVLVQIQDRNGISETVSVPERLQAYSRVDFLSSQPYKQVLRVYRTEGQAHSLLTTYHPNGSPWQYLEAKEMRAHGAFRQWFPNGVQQIEATVIGGVADLAMGSQKSWLFEGISKVWDEEGRLVAVIPYEKGALSGTSVYYYPSGGIKEEIPYSQDSVEGEAREFWEEGQIKSKSFFSGGKKQGESVSLWPNGDVCWKEQYRDGLLWEGRYFLPSQEMVCEVKEGEGVSACFEGKRLAQLCEIRNGKVEGLIQIFDEKGKLASQYQLKDGKRHGEEILYYPGGQSPKLSISWDADTIHGTIKTWYENNQLQSQRDMVRNKRVGSSLAWYRDGTLMLVEEYENDCLEKGRYFRKKGRDPVSTVTNGTGIATLYDEEGALLHKVQYIKGKPIDPD